MVPHSHRRITIICILEGSIHRGACLFVGCYFVLEVSFGYFEDPHTYMLVAQKVVAFNEMDDVYVGCKCVNVLKLGTGKPHSRE